MHTKHSEVSSFTLLVFQKINPNIEYYIRNNTNFTATKDGLILTNVILHSLETAIMEVSNFLYDLSQDCGKKGE